MTSIAAGDVYSDIGEWGVSDIYLDQLYSNNLMMPLDDPQIADIMLQMMDEDTEYNMREK